VQSVAKTTAAEFLDSRGRHQTESILRLCRYGRTEEPRLSEASQRNTRRSEGPWDQLKNLGWLGLEGDRCRRG
jgi:hypothetical protein